MVNPTHNRYINWTLALYFGWLLSFPFYGPVLAVALPADFAGSFSPALIFAFFHAISLLLGGILLKNTALWKKLMLWSLAATIAVNAILLFPSARLWPWGMALLGASSAIYILGWSYPYTVSIPVTGRMRQMASIIIGANLISIFFNYISAVISPGLTLALATAPLFTALAVLLRSPADPDHVLPSRKAVSLPSPLILIFCLFIAGLYLNGGFMHIIIFPFLETDMPFYHYISTLPYIAVLLLLRHFGTRLQRYFPVYMGVTLLGMAFVSFALLDKITAGLFLTETLMGAAFALLDLFVWTTLGDLAFIYGAPFLIFGLANAATVSSIIAGDLIGSKLLQIGETHRLVTAVFAAAAIFSAFAVIPWLNERINKDLSAFKKKSEEESPVEAVTKSLPPKQRLTPRETEITVLILKGITNKEIAKQLFISENTLKTHLKHIFSKFGVSNKRGLLTLAAQKENDNTGI
ncbi:MAG: helix-turn-helix transcriptional regulator [Dethiobacter sp.]|jgi:DNA-binding CsgD family transcriptional regulator|nr:helix-turn-helix transcriptional regulator [Dethiobacter sp.]